MNFFTGGHRTSCGPTIYVAADHAGFHMKTVIASFLRLELGCDVVDCGADSLIPDDDYPGYIACAARLVAEDPENRMAVVFGGSGQGEAMVANRFPGIRAALYYGSPGSTQMDATGTNLTIVTSSRIHNNANVLSIGARFINEEETKEVVRTWILTPFSGEERHQRRIRAIEEVGAQ